MFYPYPDWQKDPDRCVYLGSEKNPRTKYPYDYWLIRTGEPTTGWSPTYRFGPEGPDYGSFPLCIAWYDFTHLDGREDHLFGSARVRQLALYYLATGERPLLQDK